MRVMKERECKSRGDEVDVVNCGAILSLMEYSWEHLEMKSHVEFENAFYMFF
jgi:hypothetical protein